MAKRTSPTEATPRKREESVVYDGDTDSVAVSRREVALANTLVVEVGTSCDPKRGGDSGHGYRTILRIRDGGGTDLRARVRRHGGGGGAFVECADAAEVTLVLGGTSECDTLLECLRFAETRDLSAPTCWRSSWRSYSRRSTWHSGRCITSCRC
jgi:hypothetical protein